MTLPNGLTFLRLLSLPAILALAAAGHGAAAAAVFLAGMLTDVVDGWLARRLNQSSLLGVYLDPLVDKIVILSLLYDLAHRGLLPAAVAHLFLARELLHSGVRDVAAQQGRVVGANWMGKTKAALQTVLVAAGLLLPGLTGFAAGGLARPARIAYVAFAWVTLAVSGVFFGVFAYRNRRFLAPPRGSPAPPPAAAP